MMRLGTRIAHENELWRVSEVILLAGERFYFLVRWDGFTALLPAAVVEEKPPVSIPPEGSPHAFQ